MNLTGRKITAGTAPEDIVLMLADQLVNCVMWEPSILGMIKALRSKKAHGWVARMASRSSMSVGP